jgi:peptidyl-prolyl cis-trans isomerase D
MGIRDEDEIGVIQKIQGKTGCLLLVMGFALLAFVLTEFISAKQSGSNQGNNPIGQIGGEIIDLTDYNVRVDQKVAEYQRLRPDLVIDNEARDQIREEIWGEMIQEGLIQPEYESLGIEVSDDELEYVTVGAEPHRRVVEAFPMPDDKPGFNRERLIQFLNEEMQDDENRAFTWVTGFEEPIKRELLGGKYSALLKSTVYTTTLEAEADFANKNRELSAIAVGLPYLSIADSTLSYDDDDLKAYLKENKDQYQQIATRDVEMAIINVTPTASDTSSVIAWAQDKIEAFKASDDDSTFVDLQGSETIFDTVFRSPGAIQDRDINAAVFAAEVGDVLGPFIERTRVSVYKVSQERLDSVNSMRAEHILVVVEGPERSDSLAALAKARALMAEIKAGTKNWDEEAAQNQDATSRMGGDLGWTKEGSVDYSLIQPNFKKQLFKQKEGDYFVALSRAGAHVGHVTGGKTNRQIQIAVLDHSIAPSSKTDQATQRVAAEILFLAQENADFGEVVESQNMVVQSADLVQESAKEVAGVDNARKLISWMYEDGVKEGDVSDVIEFENLYIIAKLIKVREKGTADFDEIKSQVEVAYLEKLKAELLSKKIVDAMEGLSTTKELADKLNTLERSIPAQRFDAQQVIGMGADLNVQGALFGAELNKFSRPIKGNTGVFVVFVNGEVEPQSTFNADVSKSILNSTKSQLTDQAVIAALRKKGEIVDERYKFFD